MKVPRQRTNILETKANLKRLKTTKKRTSNSIERTVKEEWKICIFLMLRVRKRDFFLLALSIRKEKFQLLVLRYASFILFPTIARESLCHRIAMVLVPGCVYKNDRKSLIKFYKYTQIYTSTFFLKPTHLSPLLSSAKYLLNNNQKPTSRS